MHFPTLISQLSIVLPLLLATSTSAKPLNPLLRKRTPTTTTPNQPLSSAVLPLPPTETPYKPKRQLKPASTDVPIVPVSAGGGIKRKRGAWLTKTINKRSAKEVTKGRYGMGRKRVKRSVSELIFVEGERIDLEDLDEGNPLEQVEVLVGGLDGDGVDKAAETRLKRWEDVDEEDGVIRIAKIPTKKSKLARQLERQERERERRALESSRRAEVARAKFFEMSA
ncbi:hypothetical protein T439DRAFT_330188 [Meredithblackwellia eburnea MCA 4105]